jgi:hypothetical protein
MLEACDKLAELSKQVRIPEMVQLMKRIVPEFKSMNSIFEMYDKIEDNESNKLEK